MRLSPTSFYDMTLPEFLLAAQGFHDLEENRERNHWERTRWLATLMLQPHAKKGTRMKPTDIAKFPWDKQPSKESRNKLLEHTLKNMANA